MQHFSCRHPNKHQRPCFLSKLQACQLRHMPALSCYLGPHGRTVHHLPSPRCSSSVCQSAAAAATFSKTRPQTSCANVPPDLGPSYSDRNQLQGNAVLDVAFEGAVSSLCVNGHQVAHASQLIQQLTADCHADSAYSGSQHGKGTPVLNLKANVARELQNLVCLRLQGCAHQIGRIPITTIFLEQAQGWMTHTLRHLKHGFVAHCLHL